MFQLIKLLREAPCENRLEAYGWFARQRLMGGTGELMLKLRISGKALSVPIVDIPGLGAALALASPGNPWEKWRPAAPPRHIMDLGANVGFTSMYFAARFPGAEVVAVEMMPENAAAIARIAALNALSIRVLNVAVGDQVGEATVRCNVRNSQHSLAALDKEVNPDWGFTERRINVPITRLGTALDTVKWEDADLLKVDIEGAEQLLLRDAAGWGGRVGTVFMEIHHNVSADEARAAMDRQGFKLIGRDDEGRTELWFERPRAAAGITGS
jgi:FkbM family methyltransferase